MTVFNFLAEAGGITDKIAAFLGEWITKGYNWLISQTWWLVLIVVVVVAILLIVGLITLIVKSWKVLLVLAILGVIGYVVYTFVIKKGSGDATTTTTVVECTLGFVRALI